MSEGEPLKVLEAARFFADECVDLAKRLPRSAPAGLRTHLAESAQAVSAIIAEGFGRGTSAEKVHYSRMANGSLEETQNYLRQCINRRLIDEKTFDRMWNLSATISRMLRSLIASLERKHRSR